MIPQRALITVVNKKDGVFSVRLTHKPSGLSAEVHSTDYDLSKEQALLDLEERLGEPIERFGGFDAT